MWTRGVWNWKTEELAWVGSDHAVVWGSWERREKEGEGVKTVYRVDERKLLEDVEKMEDMVARGEFEDIRIENAYDELKSAVKHSLREVKLKLGRSKA